MAVQSGVLNIAFEEAYRERAMLRMFISGAMKHGKTTTAGKAGRGLIEFLVEQDALPYDSSYPNYGEMCWVDTEHGSAKKNARVNDADTDPSRFKFRHVDFKGPYSPENYIQIIQAAEKRGFAVIIIDQVSHEWDGLGGSLSKHAKETEASSSKNGYVAWQKITPAHQALYEAINASTSHIICTARAKVKYRPVKNDKGKMEVTKIGIRPIARDTTEYEFDIAGMMSIEGKNHILSFEGTRCPSISHSKIVNPDDSLGRLIGEWLRLGDTQTVVEKKMIDNGTVNEITTLIKQAGLTNDEVVASLARRGATRVHELYPQDAADIIKQLKGMVRQAKLQQQAAPIVINTEPAPEPEAIEEPTPEPESEIVTVPVVEAAMEPALGVEVTYWRAEGDESVETSVAEIQGLIDSGLNDPDTHMLFRSDDTEWRTASYYGFVSRFVDSDPPAVQADPEPNTDDNFEANVNPNITLKGPSKAKSRSTKPATDPDVLTPAQIGDELLSQMESQTKSKAIKKTKPAPEPEPEPEAEVASDRPMPPAKFDFMSSKGRNEANTFASDLAAWLGYDKERWNGHLQAKGSNLKSFLSLTPLMMEEMIADLIVMSDAKDEEGDKFDLDEWQVSPDVEEKPAPKSAPKGRPKGK